MLEVYCDMEEHFQVYQGDNTVSGLFETREEAINDICLELID